ncbi:hypothetical protein PICMEDRAFT_12398 [Pichia membranifaciens NRRL Y-2026]|uniref:MATE efflux family protein n=1 Tax=Pichia membranifaciens NRRL Y-2026 TaxID=763406 RepID=A0A1E3NIJ5_9ASCO|nr:hypothetical protein PICMEDRAFT_12398 [Pichia membranifaciens NRRL Y-2026]ODQ45957.1 hypothetical protein PICMEDRAFT_12398 [Pichia membranifaciens NRRL Y-2026]
MSDGDPLTPQKNTQRRRPTGLFSKTIGQLPRSLLTSNNVAINSKRRKIPLTFLPPSTKSPLFVYSNDYDQRSFLSLCSGSHIDEADSFHDNLRGDNESVSTFRSLPSTLEGNNDEIESIHQWLDEERERRSLVSGEDLGETYGAINEGSDDIMARADRYFPSNTRRSSFLSLEGIVKDEEEEDFEFEKVTTRKEIDKLFRYSIPLIITFFLEQIFSLVCVVFVGHLGKEELAAVSMASMTSTIVLAIFEGIATSLDTLCPQAYGAGQYKYVGIHTQRCSLFSLVMFVPAALFWYFSGYFLSFIIDDRKVIKLTQQFLRILILAGPPYILFENGKRFLQAQGIFDAGTYILFITAPMNIFLNWLLVYSETFGLGYVGAPIASVINFWAMLIFMILYIVLVDGSECWDGFTLDAFNHWYDLSKLAFPGIVMLLAESMAYEVLTLFASKFGTSALATQSALSSVVSLLYMIPFAIAVASSTRIANFVGAANIQGGRIAINVGFISSVLIALINSAVIFFGARHIALLFTDDEEVITMFVNLCPLISVFVIFDSLACVASGILRALAMQMIGGTISLVGYYIIAVPLALYLSFHSNLQLLGLWLGNGAGLLTIGITEIWIIYNVEWKEVIEHAKSLALHGDS